MHGYLFSPLHSLVKFYQTLKKIKIAKQNLSYWLSNGQVILVIVSFIPIFIGFVESALTLQIKILLF